METLPKPLTIGCDPQLLMDDHVVDDIWMIRRSPELPVRSLDNPIFVAGSPFAEAHIDARTVLFDEDRKLFRMWYGVDDAGRPIRIVPLALKAGGALLRAFGGQACTPLAAAL